MSGERIGNSNQYLTISGVVSAPAYSWASDNDTGLYRIGANNIGIAASGTKVLDISTTAVTITPATTLSAALTYGGITLSNAVTGTGNMVLSASPTLTGTLTAAAGTFSSTFGATGAATFGSTIASGAVTSTGAVTGTYFTATAAATNGLGLVAANTPALYASTTEFMRSTTSLTTFALDVKVTGNMAIGGTAYSHIGLHMATAFAGAGTTQHGIQLSPQFTTSSTLAANAFNIESWGNAAGSYTITNMRGVCILAPTRGASSTITNLYGLYIQGMSQGTTNYAIYTDGGLHYFTGATTCASSVTATLFTPTATGNNGLGLAASGKPAIYAAGTSEIMRFDFADTTAYMVGIGGAPLKITTNIATLQVYGASGGGGFRFGRDSTKEGLIYHDGTNILFQSYTPSLGTFLTITGSTGAATFASSVTATLFTPTATGNNGLGLAAANTPALYASTTEVLRATTTQITNAVNMIGAKGFVSGRLVQASAVSGTYYDLITLSSQSSSGVCYIVQAQLLYGAATPMTFILGYESYNGVLSYSTLIAGTNTYGVAFQLSGGKIQIKQASGATADLNAHCIAIT